VAKTYPPDILIYLEVSYLNTIKRRNLNWTEQEFEEQLFRLRHARSHADLIINTDTQSPEQIAAQIQQFINPHDQG
jgi:hypothetical protein